MRTILGKMSFLLLCFSFCLFGCKQTGDNGNAIEEIRITIQADQGVKIGKQNTVNVPKNAKWASFKDKVFKLIEIESITESVEWHINNASGTLIEDETKFSEDKVIFGVSKLKTVSYKVEHLQQNITDNEYSKFEEESKTGFAGTDTQAVARTYGGFASKTFTQEKIKADGSTVIRIYYDRNEITLTLDLQGGTTTTTTENGESGKVLLKGKFGANVKVENLTKSNHKFVRWNPELPTTFPAINPTQVYTVEWKKDDLVKVNILADERFDVSSPAFIEVSKSDAKKWADIKEQAKAKLTLKAGWDKEDYGFYDWKMNSYEGEKVDDNHLITSDITVYARSNYTQFKINGTTIQWFRDETDINDPVSANPHRPMGRIIIPKGITILGNQSLGSEEITHVDFSDVNLKEMQKNCLQNNKKLDNVDLSSCTNLTVLGAFQGCTNLKTIDFSKCTKLATIWDSCFKRCTGLTGIMDLSSFTNLTTIMGEGFGGCTNLTVKLPTSITSIESAAFGDPNWGSAYCKQVIVPNEQVKALVLAVNYPENQILVQP